MPPARLMSSSKTRSASALGSEECSVTGGRQHGVNFVGIAGRNGAGDDPPAAAPRERRDESTRMHYVFGVSKWPPKPKRIAERTLFWKSASPRELKRA